MAEVEKYKKGGPRPGETKGEGKDKEKFCIGSDKKRIAPHWAPAASFTMLNNQCTNCRFIEAGGRPF